MTPQAAGWDAVPLLSIVVPAFNAVDYLERALLGLAEIDGVEVVIVDDGSTDTTGELADRWAARHPGRVRAIHQDNRGHGGAINAGIAAARGTFLKVLDADDWLDLRSLRVLVDALGGFAAEADAVFTDFIHERVGKTRRPARFDAVFPAGRLFAWGDTERFSRRHVLMMHAIVYRTSLLREMSLGLPEHMFYVDNLFVVEPLIHVRRMAYLPVPLYRYLVGREGQSVSPEVMVRRVDQQLRVNRLALAALPKPGEVAPAGEVPVRLYQALLHHLEAVCAVTSATLVRAGTASHLRQRDEFWHEVRAESPWLYSRMRRTLLGTVSNLPGGAGRRATRVAYHVARRVVGFS